MKKEIVVGAFLILMLAAALVNIHFLNKLTGNVVSLVREADSAAQREDWAEAERQAEAAAKLWVESDTYTHLVLRHPEIEAATDALYGLLSEIYAGEQGAVKGAAQAAEARLKSLASIEEIRFGSIF
jgi:predicted RNase H-like HicB family nuclease